MGLSSRDATARLAEVKTIDGLRDLIKKIDLQAGGRITVFYSGVAEDGRSLGDVARDLALDASDLRIIDKTEVADFLDVESNLELKRVLESFVGGNPLEAGTPSYNFLNGIEDSNGVRIANGVWDEVSARFAEQTVGEVRVLTSPRKEYGVFALSELPALLDNESVTSIDGIPREQLVMLRDVVGLDMVKHAVAVNADMQMHLGGLPSGDFARYLALDVGELEAVFRDAATRDGFVERLQSLEAVSRVNRESGLSALIQGGEIAAVNGVSKALNRIGYVGGVLSFMLVSAQASAAGTREEAEAIMKAWAVDAAGSEVGSVIAGTAAGIAVAALSVAVTPVAVPVAFALTLGASMLGGFFGAEWASQYYALLGDKDEGRRREVLDRLTELYFGPSATVTAETLPGTDSNFIMVDPALTPESIRQAAKSSLAWRYALLKLNPFIVPDADYERLHNANGELALFDRVSGEGMTDEYLTARAEALLTYSALFAAGREVGSGFPYPGGYDLHFLDAEMHGAPDAVGAALDLHYTSDYKAQRLFGAGGDDALTGSTQDDMLFGGDGDDLLRGGGGADYLEGGAGDDTYVAGDGDQVFDADGIGRVLFDGRVLYGGTTSAGSDDFASDDGEIRYTLADGRLSVIRVADGAALTIEHFDNGDLGIRLGDDAQLPPSDRIATSGTSRSEVIYGQTDDSVTDFERLNAYNLPDHITGREGRDWIYAWDSGPQTIENGIAVNSAPDSDLVEGGPGKDFIHGGAGDDRLYATETADAAAVEAGRGSQDYGGPEDDEGDFVSGQDGDDRLYGSGRVDGLFGGDGDDLIYAGDGDDIVAGDWSVALTTLSLDVATYDYRWYSVDADGHRHLHLSSYRGGAGRDRIYAGEGDDLVWGGAGDDVILGEAGDDQLNGDMSGVDGNGDPNLPGRYHGNDYLSGGAGNDAVNGNGGSDILLGGAGDDLLDGDFRVVIDDDAAYHGSDFLDGGAGADTLTGNGGADVLLGGDGDDALFGDLDGLDAIYHGGDVLYGDAGRDQLVGQGGDDTLHGGEDDDILYGDDLDRFAVSGDDRLFGGSGADQISGGLGDDVLSGEDGADSLYGDPGADRLSGGAGVDYLEGGADADTYVFSRGDAAPADGKLDTVVDAAGEGNRILFGSDVDPGSVSIARVGAGDDLVLRYADSDAVYLVGGLTGAVEAYAFSDGSQSGFEALVERFVPSARYLAGGPGSELVFGGGRDDLLHGDGGDDELRGGGGDDVLQGGEGGDLLTGGIGDDVLEGGAGSDEYRFEAGHGHDLIDDAGGFDVVRFTDAVFADLHFAEAAEALVVSTGTGSVTVRRWRTGAIDAVIFADDTVTSIAGALAGPANLGRVLTTADREMDAVEGTPGDDIFQVAEDGLSLRGGVGNDVYRLSPHRPATLVVDASGDTTLVIEGGIEGEPYLNRDSDDLVLVVDGAAVARVRDGWLHPPARLVTADGRSLEGAELAARINTGPAADVSLATVAVEEDAALSWRVPDGMFVDADDPTLGLSLSRDDGGVLPKWLSFDPQSGTLSGMPGNPDVGAYGLRLTATDRGGMSAAASLQLEVLNVNDAPSVSSSPGVQQVPAGDAFRFDLAGIFADVDPGDRLLFHAAGADGGALPDWLSLDPETGVLSAPSVSGEAGHWDLLLTAEDAEGATARTVVRLEVVDGGGLSALRATTIGPTDELHFRSISSAGDIDGDGFDDLLVQVDRDAVSGTLSEESGLKQAAYLIYGQGSGWGEVPERVTLLYEQGAAARQPATSPDLEPAAGLFDKVVLAALGDVDGDGYDDIGLTSVVDQRVTCTLLFGGRDGLGASLAEVPLDQQTRLTLGDGGDPYSAPAVRILASVDLDGDGGRELLFATDETIDLGVGIFPDIGAWRGRTVGTGAFLLEAGGKLTVSDGGFVRGVQTVGDVNGDGYEDVYVASYQASYSDDVRTIQESYHLLFGGQPLSGEIDLADRLSSGSTEFVFDDWSPYPDLVAEGLGDVNGDGIDDLALAARHVGPKVVFGSPVMPPVLDLDLLQSGEGFDLAGRPLVPKGFDGFDIASGDINGDLVADIVIGSHPFYASTEPVQRAGSGIAGVVLGRAGEFPGGLDFTGLAEGEGFTLMLPYPDEPVLLNNTTPLPGVEQVAVLDVNGDKVDDVVKTVLESDGNRLMSRLYTLYGQATATTSFRVGGDGDDLLAIGGQGTLYALAGNDRVQVTAADGRVEVYAGEGNDSVALSFASDGDVAGEVLVDAGAGNDVITLDIPKGFSGVSWRSGGITLRGGAGADAYRVSRSGVRTGQVFIDDRSRAGERNSLVLGSGYSSSSIRLAYGSLVIGFVDDGLEVHLVNFDRANAVDGVRDIDTFVFSDGTTLSYADIIGLGFDLNGGDREDLLEGSSAVDRMYGLAGNDVLDAGAGDDLLVGGPGSDVLHGGVGDDTYRFELGEGSDVVMDVAGRDSIRFGAGVAADGLRIGREGDDLRIGYGEAESVSVQRWFADGLNRIERFDFDDGTSLTDWDIEQRLAPPLNIVRGTDRGELLAGTLGGDAIAGGGGNDFLLGLAGGDRLRGGEGDDTMLGGRGDDLLVGGVGNDRLVGGRGSDEYRFDAGDGSDRIHNASWSGAEDHDVLRFGQGLAPDRLWFSRHGVDLVAQVIGSRDRVSVAGWFADDATRIDRVVAGRGEAIAADQLDRLVGALATFGVERAPVVELSRAQQESYSAMIADYWEAPAEGGARVAG